MAHTERLGQLCENLVWKQYLPDEPYRPTCPKLPEGQ